MKSFLIALLLSSCSFFPPDNPVEELIEAEIRDMTGLDIDLTSEDKK